MKRRVIVITIILNDDACDDGDDSELVNTIIQ